MAEAHPETPADTRRGPIANAGARYGLFVALTMALLIGLAPQPWGAVTLGSVVAIQSAIGTVIVWRRLRLRYFTAGGVAATFVGVSMILYSLRGQDPATIAETEPWPILVAIYGAVVLVPLSIGAESLVKSPGWEAWRRRMGERPSIWEMLTFRHVPDLRGGHRV